MILGVTGALQLERQSEGTMGPALPWKTRNIPFDFWKRTGPAGNTAWMCSCAAAIAPTVEWHSVPAACPEPAAKPGALGEGEILADKTTHHLSTSSH